MKEEYIYEFEAKISSEHCIQKNAIAAQFVSVIVLDNFKFKVP